MNKVIQEPDEDTSEVQVNIMEDNEDLKVNLKSKSELHEAQNNVVELTKVPNSDSKELKLTNFIDSTKGKPWCIILLFYATFYIYCLVHLSYWS